MSEHIDISILYIEDDDTVRNSVARSLSLIIKNVIVARNGLEALTYLIDNNVDIVITDIRMPKMDGLTFIEKLRKEKIGTPVIITSAFRDTEYIIKALELKVDKFISKPINIYELIDVITSFGETVINKKELRIKQQELENYKKAIEKTNLILTIDQNGKLSYTNQEFASYFGTDKEHNENVKGLIYDILDQKDIDEILRITKDLDIYHKTIPLRYNGNSYMVLVTGFASVFYEHTIKEITLILTDISPIVKNKDKTIKRLYTDELTSLPNRQRLFKDLLDSKEKSAIFIIDIDHFSHINHLYGFDGGDEILQQTAKLLSEYWPSDLKRKLYKSDMDHFVIFIENSTPLGIDIVSELANSINNKIKNHTFL